MPVPLWTSLAVQGAPPEQGSFMIDPKPFAVLLLLGLVVGTLGHIFRSRTLVIVGILMIFLAALALPLLVALTH